MAVGWSPRQVAAAQALGAPKGNPRPAQPKVKANLRPQKSNPAPKHNANPHHPMPGHGPAHAGPNPENLPVRALNQQQINQRGVHLAQQQMKVETAPLQNASRELSASEAAAQQRYKAFGEAQSANLAGLSQQAEAGAKTAENRAADLALKTGKGVETSGQAEAGQLGGFVSPELKAQMLAAGQRASETSGANQSLAAQSGQNEINYLTNLRAAAAQKVTEGSKQLAAPYAKALSENQAKQREAISKVGPNSAKYAQELGKEQFNQLATEKGLGIKIQSLGQKAQETKARVGAQIRGQNISAATSRENNERTTRTSRENKQAELNYKETHPPGSKSSAPKTPSPASAQKYISEVGAAEAKARLWLGKKKNDPAQQRKVREALMREGATGDQVSAALNLAVYGRLGPKDQEAADAYGEVKRLRPAWFKHK